MVVVSALTLQGQAVDHDIKSDMTTNNNNNYDYYNYK